MLKHNVVEFSLGNYTNNDYSLMQKYIYISNEFIDK